MAARGTVRDPWRLLFVGSLAQIYKGPDVAIAALARCRARGVFAHLTLIGDGRERPALEARARRLGVAPWVTFTGQLPAGGPVREAMDRADVFVLPSRTEGTPRAMLEAMARGVACVGAAVGGIPELLPATRLVEPCDAERLASVLIRVCSNRSGLLPAALSDREVARRYRAADASVKRASCYRRVRDAVLASRRVQARPIPQCAS
jgi:glycosyltransferase involved in cell wall biosynthesis